MALAGISSCGDPREAAPESPPQAPDPTPAERQPPAACLAVDELWILAPEVDRIAAWVALIQPTHTLTSRRRQALTHVVLERAALASAHAEARAEVRDRAAALALALRGDEAAPLPDGATRAVVEGTWDDVGLLPWGEAREAWAAKGPDDTATWTDPVEDAGRWLVLRPLEHVPGVAPGLDLYRIDLVTLPYVPADLTRAAVEATIDDAELLVVDPAWREVVPAAWRLRMNGPD